MDIVNHTNALKLLYSLILRRSAVIPMVDREDERQPFPLQYDGVGLRRGAPEEVGISSEHISRFYNALCSEPSLDLQSVSIARRGVLISAGEFFPNKCDVLHVTHSLCKSVTCLAVGLLYDDGLLGEDERLCDIFPEYTTPLTSQNMTLYHLLTMSSGVMFNETGAVTDNNWVKSFLSSKRKFMPGKRFEYNSMNTYMLSATVCKKSGSSLSELLSDRLFKPMGINSFYWEKCPCGIEKGGWGLYMFPEDIMKLGQLVLQDGVWEGKRLISSEWLKKATSVQIKTPHISGVYDYGYQMWVDPKHDEVLFNGMFGQNLHIFRRTKILVMTTGSNSDIFQRCRAYPIIKKYFGKSYTPNSVLPDNDTAPSVRKCTLCKPNSPEESFLSSSKDTHTEFIKRVSNRRFISDKKESIGISVLPTIVQAVDNNFSDGISEISFVGKQGDLYIRFTENIGVCELKVGFGCAEDQTVVLGNESFHVSVYAEAVTDEDKNDVLKLSIAFLELSNTRRFRFYFYKSGLVVKCSETPGYDFAALSLRMIAEDSLSDSVRRTISPKLEKELDKTLRNFLSPTFHATEVI